MAELQHRLSITMAREANGAYVKNKVAGFWHALFDAVIAQFAKEKGHPEAVVKSLANT